MRTTIDIPDDLARRAKMTALERRTTLREMVLRGLNTVLAQDWADKTDPVDRLQGLGSNAWKGVDPDQYMTEARDGWE